MTQPPGYTVCIKATAEREMVALPKAVFRTVSKKIFALESNPRPRQCKKLSGRDEYRLRAGDYRFLYVISDSTRTVEIVAIGNRKDVYQH